MEKLTAEPNFASNGSAPVVEIIEFFFFFCATNSCVKIASIL